MIPILFLSRLYYVKLYVKEYSYVSTPVQVCYSIHLLSHHTFLPFTNIGDDRILIFASNEQLNVLQSAHHFMSDGTFKVVPEIFYQLYIIHAIYRDHVLPVIYALLRRKNVDTYRRLFNEILKVAPQWAPQSIMIDFEKACISAYEGVFPNILLSGCYFHLKQNLHRKLQVLYHSL